MTAGLICAAIDWVLKGTVDAAEVARFRWWWKPVDALWIFLAVLFLGGPSAFVYADWQRARRSAARLHTAGLARTQAARAILQRRLQAMQARIEPQFLFDTLAHIREIYQRDAVRGEVTLDHLIAYLRSAMPQMRGNSSTLACEVDLVRSYVAIVAARSDGRVRLTVDGDAEASIAFPPMLLLPLVDHAIARSRLARVEDGAIELHIAASGDRVQVTMVHGGNAFSNSGEADAIQHVRERLDTLFEGMAKLELRTRADRGTQLAMEIPR
jgi:LytS/YehU family sensor histidine kinase